MPDWFPFLRKVALFADLDDASLQTLCSQVEELRVQAGEVLFLEGQSGRDAYVIRQGEIEIYKTSGSQEVQLAVRQSGEMIGELALLENEPRAASGRALTESHLLVIHPEVFDRLLGSGPNTARTMLHTAIARLRSTEMLLQQNEKMAALGKLTAGVAHELNNPASAVRRAADQFTAAMRAYQQGLAGVVALPFTTAQVETLLRLAQAGSDQPPLLPLERADREHAMEDWLDGLGLEDGWQIAQPLVEMGHQPQALAQALQGFSPETYAPILRQVAAGHALTRLVEEIGQGAGRISEIVRALKSYAYLDQAPVQPVNIQDGLENTLIILRHKLPPGVEVQRRYDPALPAVQGYGSELNQVWTNLIDNAIDAVDGQGQITIQTSYRAPWVVVDIGDSGPGIPPEIQKKIFAPFFTTKPAGQGTGLGLNITYSIIHKHNGDVQVTSQPGETHFSVWLPVDFQTLRQAGPTLQPIHRADDNSLRQIFLRAHTIAVVGLSSDPQKPAYFVPAYLQRQGYRILPVNPRIESALGETTFPTLEAVPVPVDIVLVFRASQYVPEIVDSAIAISAPVVWMQEGIVNEAAAQKASQAGIEVVMDTCMRRTHRRIFSIPVDPDEPE